MEKQWDQSHYFVCEQIQRAKIPIQPIVAKCYVKCYALCFGRKMECVSPKTTPNKIQKSIISVNFGLNPNFSYSFQVC